ncbi:hypothetical protein BofuT4_uP157070.1 [Botrytis cinerea T4]|uniref:Uncharacterized protein n=1 Tax=Botryotinia fuckeliana (strain T4) TaxID=999810 RepID=G2YUL3_BOTF4|nr:hypothetical protein BofuT4_uP157070.1 [Botrytis cinerea T4]
MEVDDPFSATSNVDKLFFWEGFVILLYNRRVLKQPTECFCMLLFHKSPGTLAESYDMDSSHVGLRAASSRRNTQTVWRYGVICVCVPGAR